MFSPGLTRFIVDPENITEEFNQSKTLPDENKLLMRGTIEYDRVLNDYNFFTRLLGRIGKVLFRTSAN